MLWKFVHELHKKNINEAHWLIGGASHHCSDDPADVDRITSALHVLCQVFQRILGIVQDLKADVHDQILELGGAERSRGEGGEAGGGGGRHNEHHREKQVEKRKYKNVTKRQIICITENDY